MQVLAVGAYAILRVAFRPYVFLFFLFFQNQKKRRKKKERKKGENKRGRSVDPREEGEKRERTPSLYFSLCASLFFFLIWTVARGLQKQKALAP